MSNRSPIKKATRSGDSMPLMDFIDVAERAYAAGFLDGEGSIGIGTRPSRSKSRPGSKQFSLGVTLNNQPPAGRGRVTRSVGVQAVTDPEEIVEFVAKSGSVWTTGRAAFGPPVRHECSFYCRPSEGLHAHLAYHTNPELIEGDVAEACERRGYELVTSWATNEAPDLGRIMQPSGRPARAARVVVVRKCMNPVTEEER